MQENSVQISDNSNNQSKPPFACFNNHLSKEACKEIFSGQTYKQAKFVKDIKFIVDIGANVGASAVYFSELYPDAQIFAFEPAIAPYNLLEKNIASYKNIKSYKYGLFSEDRDVSLYPGKIDSVTGSIGKSLYNETQNIEQIILKNTQNTLQELNIQQIDILKIDTEGCEVPILESIQETFLPDIKVVYFEYHSEEDRKALDKILEDTHALFTGKATFFHRGNFCYVNKSVFDSEEHYRAYSIIID